MTRGSEGEQEVLRDLGNGFVLRRATAADTEAVVALNGEVHADAPQTFSAGIAAWTCDLMSGNHPTYRAYDWTVIEDRRAGRIVSTMCLLSQVWSYSGISFGVGRPELVGTLPEYRRRGLVRAQLDALHGWSVERGELVQAITGIPWYYRQFGYELGGLNLGGARTGYLPLAPALEFEPKEPYTIRAAREEDLPFIARVYERRMARDRVACVRSEPEWRYELGGRDPASELAASLCVIETVEGESAGYVVHSKQLRNDAILLTEYELLPNTSWLAVTPVVIRHLVARACEYAARDGQQARKYAFGLGAAHPSYEVAAKHLPQVQSSYAWYLRVVDIAGFVQHIASVLEQRLATSSIAGHSGHLSVSFYRSGLRLRFKQGVITADCWQPAPTDRYDAAFPGLTFLQLLFGYRSLDELTYAFADCEARGDESRALLNALFPKQSSNVWALA